MPVLTLALTRSNLRFLMGMVMAQEPQGEPVRATSTAGKAPRMPAPMESAAKSMNPREHVAERFEDFARKLVDSARPAKSKKRTRTRKH
jgi:hypothetical protein